ncbi:hypothetical protein [Nitrososphaera viennensis]|uniref:Uncharacterized protein n=2 Tax=Nitrososphaera viennensis TaxID=1034015 RepID=A0A060HLT7_9ARCH|nr:hypothetical protein [Nitrososphaera viennensis]AIC16418.1 hypothetical protein NVIE_021540 [Nitrososphaera viennensis EN76]UVS68350.1 hypothetical protein NWT39_10620 [Nitrososphaera viennensis]
MAKIKIVKEKKATDYTFTGDTLDLENIAKDAESIDVTNKKDKANEPEYKLRADAKLDKIKHKSKITGGHSMQGHSPVYE